MLRGQPDTHRHDNRRTVLPDMRRRDNMRMEQLGMHHRGSTHKVLRCMKILSSKFLL